MNIWHAHNTTFYTCCIVYCPVVDEGMSIVCGDCDTIYWTGIILWDDDGIETLEDISRDVWVPVLEDWVTGSDDFNFTSSTLNTWSLSRYM